MLPPFPQALHGKKEIKNSSEILKVLRQVKVNIPLLDMIKQVPTYAKFLKDLCTVKRGLHVTKNTFLTEQVSAIIQNLGASVNLLPYSMYKQLGLGGLKPTAITLSLADRSVKIPRRVIEDVLVQVDKFYYPVDFVVLDTDPTVKEANYVPIILGRPFLATSNAIINCRNGVMQLTFGNMTLELNIFHLCKRHLHPEEEEGLEEVCLINTLVEEHCDKNLEESLNESLEVLEEGLPEPSDVLAIMSPWRRKEEILPLFNEEDLKGVAREDPPKLVLNFFDDLAMGAVLGQRVLLYDSKLHLFPGKLKSRWMGPFIIHDVQSNGVVELLNFNSTRTFKVNGHRLKPYIESFSRDKEEFILLDPPPT
ncbi:hypothetical protein CK203_110878 [Vitis vinifera]|uniref:Uncharacterized protein n=1 Tax=Vitis vinifera TaxID=29760 RepID=A0A438FF17_VITVI|nr:hypothetical protein CK203_110878 [Vitis vinifera]